MISQIKKLVNTAMGSGGHSDLQDQLQKEIDTQLEVQKNATSYQQWIEAAQTLDSLLGNDQWKMKKESGLYHYNVVEHRMNQLRSARESGDMDLLMYLLRTTLQRNLGNMGDTKLYSTCYSGTKDLIESYISECELALKTLMEETQHVDSRVLLSSLMQTRKAFGRTALVLSGGSTFGMLHIGVIKELNDQNLLPRVISGSSAGSIFASVLCIHKDEEIGELINSPLLQKDFEIFGQPGQSDRAMDRLARFLKYGTWFDNTALSNTMKELLGDLTFQEAYYRTRRVLNVTVSSSSVHEMPRLLNYLTAPNVLIWSAVCASCSVPLVFASYDIQAKDPKTGDHYSWSPSTFIDGSVDNDLPLSRLSEMFNVNHFIACQVNPHIVPFLHLNQRISSFDQDEHDNTKWRDRWNSAQSIVRNELSHYLLMLSEVGIWKNTSSKLRSVLAQQYSGDITILPEINFSELNMMFKNPSREYVDRAILRAAQATWPKIAVIRNHCVIELALDQAIHDLKSRLLIPESRPLRKATSISGSQSHDRFPTTQSPNSRSAASSPSKRRSHGHGYYQHQHHKKNHQRQLSDGLAVRYLLKKGSTWSSLSTTENGGQTYSLSRRPSYINLSAFAPNSSRTLPPTRRSSISSPKS